MDREEKLRNLNSSLVGDSNELARSRDSLVYSYEKGKLMMSENKKIETERENDKQIENFNIRIQKLEQTFLEEEQNINRKFSSEFYLACSKILMNGPYENQGSKNKQMELGKMLEVVINEQVNGGLKK